MMNLEICDMLNSYPVKFEEVCAPRFEKFCLMTVNTYTRDHVQEMENQVLAHFSFQIYTPTPKTFLRRFIRAVQASPEPAPWNGVYNQLLNGVDVNRLSFLEVSSFCRSCFSGFSCQMDIGPIKPSMECITGALHNVRWM